MNGIIHIHDETYRSDRNGNDLGEFLPGIVSVHPTWDIDRAGSRARSMLLRNPGSPGTEYVDHHVPDHHPERGEIVRYQRGHWRLSIPGIVYDGAVHGYRRIVATTDRQGYDIIDDIAGAGLTETFYAGRW